MWGLVKFLAICLRSTCVVGRRRGSAKEAVTEPGQAGLAQLSPGQKSESESESDRCEAEAQDDRSRRMKTGKRGGGAEESIPFRRKDNPAPCAAPEDSILRCDKESEASRWNTDTRRKRSFLLICSRDKILAVFIAVDAYICVFWYFSRLRGASSQVSLGCKIAQSCATHHTEGNR